MSSGTFCRPGLRTEFIPVSGQDMLRNNPASAPGFEFVPLAPQAGPAGSVCTCLVGRPCLHGSTGRSHCLGTLPSTVPQTPAASSSASAASTAAPAPAHGYSLRSGPRHMTPQMAAQLLEETEILRPPYHRATPEPLPRAKRPPETPGAPGELAGTSALSEIVLSTSPVARAGRSRGVCCDISTTVTLPLGRHLRSISSATTTRMFVAHASS
jgi:hypothetical protein